MAIKLNYFTNSQEIPLGVFVDDTDGKTAETALTINNTDIKLWKHGATSLVNKNLGGATHMANGIYYCTLDATDTNTLGALIIFVHVAGALPVRVECEVLPNNVYNSLVAGTDKLQTDTVEVAGATQSARDIGLDTFSIRNKTDQLVFTIANKVDASIQAAGDFAQAAADKVWATAVRTLTAFGFTVPIKKNAALNNFMFFMKQSADHISPATGLTVTAERSIDGGAFAACANPVSEVGNGVYKINLTNTDLNGDVITLKFTAAGADQRTITIVTQA